MIESINGDIANHIWRFFLDFDYNDARTCAVATSLATEDDDDGKKKKNPIDFPCRRVDFQSIRSLRSVNKLFYKSFEEFQGWSRFALAIKREYSLLKNDDTSFENWNFLLRAHSKRTAMNDLSIWTSKEHRDQYAKFVMGAMERKKKSDYRCKILIQMLDRGPFGKGETLLTNERVNQKHSSILNK
mmetsp:Transcript_18024/g.36971  ORF Transcript_18024/g.36971 Transcript_18024/m.36971 type:complete len:186 (+) Transcript_18024:115-672(+)